MVEFKSFVLSQMTYEVPNSFFPSFGSKNFWSGVGSWIMPSLSSSIFEHRKLISSSERGIVTSQIRVITPSSLVCFFTVILLVLLKLSEASLLMRFLLLLFDCDSYYAVLLLTFATEICWSTARFLFYVSNANCTAYILVLSVVV